MKFSVILAATEKGGIGKGNAIPWRLKPDMDYFKKTTTATMGDNKKNAVITGRLTWESIPAKFKPLPDRINVVVSTNPNISLPEGVLEASSLEDALSLLEKRDDCESVFICGGARLYTEALKSELCETLYLTKIYNDIECDVIVSPDLLPPPGFKRIDDLMECGSQDNGGISYNFLVFEK